MAKKFRLIAKTKSGDIINQADFETKEEAEKLANFYRVEGAVAKIKRLT